jgi:hypothetical protein
MARQYAFGTGNLFLMPVGGGAPIQFGALQDVNVSFSGAKKELYGASAFPVDTARGKQKIDGKATFAQIDPALYNAVYFGQTLTVGEKIPTFNEAGTIPSTPFQITVANSATFSIDLGVYFASSGIALTQVVSGPTTGQYSVNNATGVYTFAAADTGQAVVLNYLYTSASTGKTLAVTNQLMGSIPVFQLVLANKTKGKSSSLKLYACTSSKLDFPFKLDDYMMSSLDFSVQDDGSGRIFEWTNTLG